MEKEPRLQETVAPAFCALACVGAFYYKQHCLCTTFVRASVQGPRRNQVGHLKPSLQGNSPPRASGKDLSQARLLD